MSIALWIVAGLLGLAFIAAGLMKLTQPTEKLAERGLAWTEDFSPSQVKGIGAVELLGGLGVILPGLTGIAPILVPTAATGLVAVMIGAIAVHIRRKETAAIALPTVLLLLAAFLAVGRFWLAPFGA
ncbi:MAG TPA: DoxX family protein [Propionicimonas sp.]|jgi:DoxX-like family|nr:DoxX family protein [Propionicimonas sp.]